MSELTSSLLSPGELFDAVIQMLNQGHDAKFTVVGNSMWPLLRSRKDQVVLRDCKNDKLKKGDIVLFKPNEEKYILHRITKVTSEGLRMTGDNNCFHDGEVSRDCVVGKVVAIVRGEKQIQCNALWVRLFGMVWIWLYPVRPFVLRVIRKLLSVFRRFIN